MKFDASLLTHDLTQMAVLARFADETGFDGIWTFETAHEPFLPLVLAAEHSRRLSLGTSIAVAFPRSPMILAQIAWDLARFSQGRFILGLGTQIDMPTLISDEMLGRFAVRGSWAELPARVLKKYEGLLDRVSYYFSIVPGQDEDGWRATVAGFKRR